MPRPTVRIVSECKLNQERKYTMKNTAKRMLAILLAAIMLGTAASCTGSGNPADTTDTAGSDSTQAVTDETATETAPETQPLPEDFVVTEEGGTASVMTPAGLT